MPAEADVPRSRRTALAYAGVAAVAAAAGATAWWRSRDGATGAGDPPPDGFWGLEFETPQGALLKTASLRGKPLLVNFWATWCPPCVEELPLIDAFYKQHAAKGWQVLALAIDQPTPVRRFLARWPVAFPVGLAGLGGSELGKSFGNLAGGLPFSVVVSGDGLVRQRKIGKLSASDLSGWAAAQSV